MRPQLTTFILLLIGLPAIKVSAQTDFVVLPKGDTLFGSVKFLNFGKDQKIQLTDKTGKKTQYEKLQVKGFYQEGHYYHTLRTAQGYAVMKLVKAGYLSLYAFQPENLTTWDGQYLYKRDGSGMEVTTLLFKKRLKSFLTECSDVTEKIESGEFSKNNLNQIVDRFNACIEQRTEMNQNRVTATNKIDELEKAVRELEESENKRTALEVITEMKLKIQRSEPVPAFFVTTLLGSLSDYPRLTELAHEALRTVQR